MNKIKLNQQLKQFLLEDIGYKDITSQSIFPEHELGVATILIKQDGILSGVDLIEEAYSILDNNIEVRLLKKDGDSICRGDKIATISGPVWAILSGERVILNLLQRMSGIATLTNRAVQTLGNPNIKLVDTRKTTPGLRIFEKYAVTCGGGFNHRFGLYDTVMIKDNHISFAGSIKNAVMRVREQLGPMIKIEVETETIDEVKEAVAENVDVIMFDNCTAEEINQMALHVPKHILTEASGGITLSTLANYQHANVDLISLGFLTHSVNALDISLTIEGGF